MRNHFSKLSVFLNLLDFSTLIFILDLAGPAGFCRKFLFPEKLKLFPNDKNIFFLLLLILQLNYFVLFYFTILERQIWLLVMSHMYSPSSTYCLSYFGLIWKDNHRSPYVGFHDDKMRYVIKCDKRHLNYHLK